MTYVIFPVRDGLVIDGPIFGSGYGVDSQEDARHQCLSANPSATGTARAWEGGLHQIGAGSVAGVDLDAEESA